MEDVPLLGYDTPFEAALRKQLPSQSDDILGFWEPVCVVIVLGPMDDRYSGVNETEHELRYSI